VYVLLWHGTNEVIMERGGVQEGEHGTAHLNHDILYE
jgi:hypothetical protein